MVRDQIDAQGVHDARVLRAMLSVPRHEFVPPELADQAYADRPLPIGYRQTISQPYIVAFMTSLLHLQGDETVLEVGTGSGYQAAVLSELAQTVHTIERYADLAEQARQRLARLGYANVVVHTGDGTLGWPEAAPYRGILVTAAAPGLVHPLADQLDEGGCLVIPVGRIDRQVLQVWRRENDRLLHEAVIPVAFVPLRGEYGWEEEENRE